MPCQVFLGTLICGKTPFSISLPIFIILPSPFSYNWSISTVSPK